MMNDPKQNLPLDDEVQIGTQNVTDSVEAVTEVDVVSALEHAEKTLPVDIPKLMESVTNEIELSSEEELILAEISTKRNNHIQQFKVDFSVDDIPDAEGMKIEETQADQPTATQSINRVDPPLKEKAQPRSAEDIPSEKPTRSKMGCLGRMIFIAIVLIISCPLAAVISTFLLDVTGSTRNSEKADIVIPDGANTEIVATILKENNLIGNVLYFRVYSRLTDADGKWQPGAFTLQGDMGFPAMIESLQVSPPRETVTVMLREGLTVDEMAEILEENKVCSKEMFLDAVMYGDYDYDFIRAIPTESENSEMMYRIYRLEGYLFPDTYEFYVGSLGETVVDKMLKNFESKLTDSFLEKIEAQGWTLDEAVTFASMVQGEGDTRENMDKVSRVLHNRLAPNSGFTKLQLCCTRDYANEMAENDHFSIEKLRPMYNTYEREGFPIGPIGNPGMDALLAAVNPSEEANIMKCYYFATDYKTGTTYFSKTLKEHQAIIKKYGITDLG